MEVHATCWDLPTSGRTRVSALLLFAAMFRHQRFLPTTAAALSRGGWWKLWRWSAVGPCLWKRVKLARIIGTPGKLCPHLKRPHFTCLVLQMVVFNFLRIITCSWNPCQFYCFYLWAPVWYMVIYVEKKRFETTYIHYRPFYNFDFWPMFGFLQYILK